MRCEFCATGKGGFARNLMPHEVIDQVMTVQELFGKRVNNVVFMGMVSYRSLAPSLIPAVIPGQSNQQLRSLVVGD